MFSSGLSLEQAPPISVPFRFFISAIVFAIFLGLAFLFLPFSEISNRYSYISIGLVHLFTLGVLVMIIFGAMQQMMPVLAGAVIKKPILFANVVHSTLVLGTVFFVLSFVFEIKFFLHIALLFLLISFLVFFIVSIKLLYKVEFLTSTVKAMRLFALSGLITILLGSILAIAYMSDNMGANHHIILGLHMLFALFGISIILIMGVAFQVIPMFYVALDFPKFIQNKVPLAIFGLLVLSSMFLFLEVNFIIFKLLLIIAVISFCFYGIKSLNNRKRPVFDVTLWFWKLSLYMLGFSMFIWLFLGLFNEYILAMVFALGFLYSLLQGMIYKIIPFLSWFHLSSKGYFQLPTIREFIEEKYIKIHFYIYCVSFAFFVLGYYINPLIYLASILFIVSNVIFLINCINAIRKYKEVLKTDPMDMSSFTMPNT